MPFAKQYAHAEHVDCQGIEGKMQAPPNFAFVQTSGGSDFEKCALRHCNDFMGIIFTQFLQTRCQPFWSQVGQIKDFAFEITTGHWLLNSLHISWPIRVVVWNQFHSQHVVLLNHRMEGTLKGT